MPKTTTTSVGLRLPLHAPTAPPVMSEVMTVRLDLSRFVRDMATHTAHDVGFSWEGSPDAPSSYRALTTAYAHSAATGVPLPVSDANLSDTIFVGKETDLALRFWHDVNHVRRSRSFCSVDELELGLWHVAVAEAEELPPLAVQLLEADLVGQQLLYAATKQYPRSQRQFDLDVVTFGIADAICLEIERTRG